MALSVFTKILIYDPKAPCESFFISLITIPLSRAKIKDDTRLTDPIPTIGLRIEATIEQVNGRVFSSPTEPTYSMFISCRPDSITCPIKPPNTSDTLTQGLSNGASAADIEGELIEFVIAPSFK